MPLIPPASCLALLRPDPDEEADEQQEGEEREEVDKESRPLSDAGDVHVMGLQRGCQLVVGDGRRDLAGVVIAPLQRAGDGAAGVDRRSMHIAGIDFGQELRVAEALGRCVRHVRDKEQDQCDEDAHRQEPHPPPWRGRGRRRRRSIVGLSRLGCSGEMTGPLHHGGDSLGWQTFDGDDPIARLVADLTLFRPASVCLHGARRRGSTR